MLSVQVHESLVRIMDNAIKKSGLYSSRSEFLKDAIRKNLQETLMLDEEFRKVHEASERLRELARKNGFNGKLPSKAEREAIAREFVKKHGIN